MPGSRRVRRELLVYIVSAVLSLAVVSVGAVVVSWRVVQAEALRDAEYVTTRLADVIVGPLLPATLAGDQRARGELDRAVDVRLRDGTVTAVHVWRADGTIAYSSDPTLLGMRVDPPEGVLRAVRAGATSSAIEGEPELIGVPGPDLVDVYVPLRLPDLEPLAFEAYMPYERAAISATLLAREVILLAVGALLVLQLVQLPITLSLGRRVSAHEADRARLLQRALSASDRERSKIAADLHDGVVQDLAGVGYALAALGRTVSEERRPGVERLGTIVRGTVDSLRRLMVDIYPPDLSGPGLAGAIEDLAVPLRAQGLPVAVHVAALPAADSETAATLYRVARETLANVAKHAAASSVVVELRPDDPGRWPDGEGILLRVTDDGVGAPEGSLARRTDGHLGLRLLADRLAEAGGELTLRPAVPTGTVAEARVPVRVG